MAQVKIYGHAEFIQVQRTTISNAIHEVTRRVLGLPENKRFHRFFPLAPADFIHPSDRSGAYLILEIHLFAGRQPQTLRALIQELQEELGRALALAADDLEIVLLESPPTHWGIRGQTGDQLQLPYSVNC